MPALSGGTDDCSTTAAALNAAIHEFNGPASPTGTIGCAFGGLLYDGGSEADSVTLTCDDTANTMNTLAETWQGGEHFQDCEVTTPTTSATTTATTAVTITASTILWYIIKITMGIRVTPEEELEGMDLSEVGMEAYPDFRK